MYPDVVKLRRWYNSPLGKAATQVLKRQFSQLLPPQPQRVLVLGYGLPLAALWQKENHQIYLGLPAQMGATWWPEGAENSTTLLWEHALPFADESFDHIICHHVLEFTASATGLLAEANRCLKPTGTLTVIAPNRMSPWSWREGTPLGRGHPFTAGQLCRLVENHDFQVINQGKCLYQWPLSSKKGRKIAPVLERMGAYLWPWAGGWVWLQATPEHFGGQAIRGRDTVWPPLLLPRFGYGAQRVKQR